MSHYYIIFCSMYPYLLGKECRYALYKVRTKSLIMRQCSVDCRVHREVMPQSTHRVAMAPFVVHSIMVEKSAQPGEGGGARPPPPTPLYLPAERADTLHSTYFYSTPMCTLWLCPLPPYPPTFYLSFAVLTVHRILHSQYAQSFHNLHSFQFFYVKKHRALEIYRYTLKGQCHEIFDFWFFSWISFPQASEYTITAISNFFENSRRYSRLQVHHRCQRHRWQMEKIFKQKNFNNFVWAPLGSRVNISDKSVLSSSREIVPWNFFYLLPAIQNFTADRMSLVTPPNSNGWTIPLSTLFINWNFGYCTLLSVSCELVLNLALAPSWA